MIIVACTMHMRFRIQNIAFANLCLYDTFFIAILCIGHASEV